MRYRKTIDTWEVQTNHGYGWDTEITEYTLQSARRQMRDYLEAAVGRWNTRIVYKRIRKSDLTPQELLDISQCYFEQVKEDKQERQERRLARKQQA